MKDELKSIVPGTPTTRRAPPQQHAAQTQRRPSDGPGNASGGGSGSRGGAAQVSPRVKLHVKDTNSSGAGGGGDATAAADGRQAPSPSTPSSSTRHNDDDASKTFLTALVATKHSKQSASHRRVRGDADERVLLRPPSPLEAVDAEKADGAGSSEPVAANYLGGDALQSFWSMFHREDAVHNHTSTLSRPPSPANAAASFLPAASSAFATKPRGATPIALTLHGDRPRSARTTYLAAVRRMNLSPEPMGIVRRRAYDKGLSSSVAASTSSCSSCASGTSTQEINLSSYRMGDAYATAFSEGFALVPGVESVNLANNRIGDAVAARIVTHAMQTPVALTLQTLNLSHKALGPRAAIALAALLRASKTLTALNLAHNALRDRDVALLCDALQKNQTLARLHLSENRFGVPGMVAIAKFLEENAKIEEVYLAWNNIRGLGALKIVEALKFHASLRALDLSWNALDSCELLRPRAIVAALADALANNKVLAHLDLANNRLDVDDCALLARQLESNQTLIGLHMSGNCGVMDTRGFLIPMRSDAKLLDQHKMYSIAAFEEAMSEAGSGSLPPHLAQLVDRFCWYCGQWSEYRFAWHPTSASGPFAGGDPGSDSVTPAMVVKLHLSHDDWRGVEMDKRDDGSFSAYRILPPGRTEYFFTVTDRADASLVSHHYIKDKPHKRLHSPACSVFGELLRVNVLRNARREGRDPCNMLQPRACRSTERTSKWDINRSVFARRRRESVAKSFVDTDAFVQKACAADWRQCKVDRFIKDPARRKDVEASVARHFRTIGSVYRRYCGHNVLTSLAVLAAVTPAVAVQMQNDVISVPWSGYVEFLSECRILDENSEFCRYADLENVFVAANLELTQEAKEKDNPDRSLTRFEFMEVVLRIAMNKYHRSTCSL